MGLRPSTLIRVFLLFHLCLLIKGQVYPYRNDTAWHRTKRQICPTCKTNPYTDPIPTVPGYETGSHFTLKHIYDPAYVPATPGGNPASPPKTSYTDLETLDAMLEKLITLDFADNAKSDILTQTIDKNQVKSKWQAISKHPKLLGEKSITLIDNTNPTIMLQDLDLDNPIKGGPTGGQTFHETKSDYQVTQITLKYDPVANPDGISISKEQFKGKLTLGHKTLAGGGQELIHLDKLNPVSRIHGPDPVGDVSFERLEAIAEAKSVLRTHLGLTNKKHPNVDRADIDTYVKHSIACTRFKRRRRNAGTGCTFSADYQDPEYTRNPKRWRGKETIEASDFIEEYKKATPEDRRYLVEEIQEESKNFRGNGKAIGEADALIKREAMGKHINLIQTADSIQNPKQKPTTLSKLSKKLEAQRVKLSQTAVAKYVSKKRESAKKYADSPDGQGLSKGLGKVSGSIGMYMLTKGIIKGFIHGDTTSLGIMAGRLGLDYLPKGMAFLKNIKSLAKPAKFLGKAAGPIGFGIDIGLSSWSLSKSVDRLKNAGNKYERNDAIADIVEVAVDIAVTTIATGLSIIFPPLAPFFMFAAFFINIFTSYATKLYKAINEVNEINEHIPLLDYEWAEQIDKRVNDDFRTRKPDYIDKLVLQKKINSMVVQNHENTLKDNPELAGLIYPAYTSTKRCNLFKTHCATKGACKADCLTWEGKKQMATDCEYEGLCNNVPEGSHKVCVNFDDRYVRTGFNRWSCECFDQPIPMENSHVDFTEKRNVYLERSAAALKTTASFKCRPGSLVFLGDEISVRDQTFEHHCKDAIALLQTFHKKSPAQFTLFALGDGSDTVKQNPLSTENNQYEITAGHKEFYSGAGSDTFQLAGPCTSLSGTLDGGAGNDTLVLDENCAKGYTILIDFSVERVSFGPYYVNTLIIKSTEVLQGRPNQKEVVILSPSVLYVRTNGGTIYDPDIIKVPPNLSSSNYSSTIHASGNMEIFLKPTRGQIQIQVTDNSKHSIATHITLPPVSATPELSVVTSFAELPSKFVTIEFTSLPGSTLTSFSIMSTKTGNKYTFEIQTPSSTHSMSGLYFILSEDSLTGSVSYLSIQPSPPAMEASIYHPLTTLLPRSDTRRIQRVGSRNIKNIFEIKNGTWDLVGGDKDDEFIPHSEAIASSINGQGGNDVLQFDASLQHQHLDIDLMNGYCLKGRLRIANINTVIIPHNFSAHVTCGCDTMSVYSMGGSFLQQVVVPSNVCQNRSLEIHASGNSELSISDGGVTWPSYVFVNITSAPQHVKQHLNFTANIFSSPGIFVNIQHDGIDWVQDKAVAGSSSLGSGTFRVRLSNPGEELVDFTFNYPEINAKTSDDDAFFTQPSVKFQSSDGLSKGQLLIDKQNGNAKILHILDSTDRENHGYNFGFQRRGMLYLENIFQIISSDPWDVVGGEESDVFAIHGNNFDGIVLDGGEGGENVLTVSSTSSNASELSILNLDLVSGYIKLGESSRVGVVKRFHHVVGRVNLPDVINVNCGFLTVNGQGGSNSPNGSDPEVYADRINIQSTVQTYCVQPLRVQIPSHTILENAATVGDFYYFVADAETSRLTLKSTDTNFHNILFSKRPWAIIDTIAFNVSASVLELKFKNGKIHVYPMANVQNGTFRNPDFKFQFNDGSILCQLHVTPEGTTHTIYSISQLPLKGLVQGLPVTVNNFIINVTKHQEPKIGSNYSRGIQGANFPGDNYFFIYNLAYPIQLLDGKGGQGSSNQIQLADEFYPNHTVLFDMNPETGKLSVINTVTDNNVLSSTQLETVVIKVVKNINEFVGRKNGKDIVYPHCNSTSISIVEEIVIYGDPSCMYGYNLIMEIGLETKVTFQSDMGDDEAAEDHYPAEGVFHYRFTSPRTFDIEGSDNVDGMHFYNLPFTIDQLESLEFFKETETLSYSVRVTENDVQQLVNCSHKMISSLSWEDQFYTQPQLLTQDGFHIRISRTGEVTMIVGSEPYGNYLSATEEDIRQELVPLFLNITKRLEATIIAGLSPEVVMHVGHGPSFKDRNILQNSVNMTSHLVGGGASDTIYDIGDLQRDVFIYPGFDLDDCGSVDENNTTSRKQVIDLSDVVATIRRKYGNKYVPQTDNVWSDLVIRMKGYEDLFPGSLTIAYGAICSSKLQLILYASAMSFKNTNIPFVGDTPKRSQKKSLYKLSPDAVSHSTQWTIAPDPILVPQGYVYTISPEDFEIGHEIRFQKNSSEKPETTFQISRNGSDLFFTDIQAAAFKDEIQDTTTIVVDGFFNFLQEEVLDSQGFDQSPRLNAEQRNPKGTNTTLLPVHSLILPELLRVIDVKVNLPGVKVVLNDTNINSISPLAPPHIVLQPDDINEVFYNAEKYLLQNFPDIERDFQTKRSQQEPSGTQWHHNGLWQHGTYWPCRGCTQRPPCSLCSPYSYNG